MTEHRIPVTHSIYYYKDSYNRTPPKFLTHVGKSIQKLSSSTPPKIISHLTSKPSLKTLQTVVTQATYTRSQSNLLQPKVKPTVSVQNILSCRKDFNNCNKYTLNDIVDNNQMYVNQYRPSNRGQSLSKKQEVNLKIEKPINTLSVETTYNTTNNNQLHFSKIQLGSPSFSNILQQFKSIKPVQSPTPIHKLDRCLLQPYSQKQYQRELQEIYQGKFKIQKGNRV